MRAVHFGAGNIGRGFIGLLLNQAGYEVVFVDVNGELIDALQHADQYRVNEVGPGAKQHTVTGFSAINSAEHPDAVVAEIAAADVVTTAVGPTILRFVAPLIAQGMAVRPDDAPPLVVMACENAVDATDALKVEIAHALPLTDAPHALPRALFANTAVDRIVPTQQAATVADSPLDVTVEAYHEWVIERGPFGDDPPALPGATFVDDLAPFIQRKLFTVNTGHATIAYFGYLAGARTIAEALAMPKVEAAVRAALDETKTLVVTRHGIAPETQQEYIEKILARFAGPQLPDTVARVGRQPLRKLSRHERFIGPAAALAERGLAHSGLLAAVGAALLFDVPEDEESVELQELLATTGPREFASQVCGIERGHPLYDQLVAQIAKARP